ncbi:signal transduction histidine kinase [Streptosporangium becharense]|uniref:histidine kinase n=1 Tax=Streptosporangium becharense TaxID=1816182 RepID=A0A7W9MH56_9ACTN|nr:histidine kinase [Streptosporangium becharense]MBB2908873.1 signal transduction histidine kinase [Streptosporangium becharense]MBB5820109.1 signal transduction histidine kinase [Streptosporangium becharense]
MTSTELTTPWERISAHWSARTWLRTAHLVTGLAVALPGAAVILGLVAAAVMLVWTVVVPVVALLLLFGVVRLLTRLQRSRFSAFLGTDIPPVPPRRLSRNPLRRLAEEARTWSAWRRLSYHLLTPLINGMGAVTVVGVWSGGLVTAAFAVRTWTAGETWHTAAFVLVSGVLLVIGPWLARGFTLLDVIAAEALLGPSVSDQLVRRVETLRESRAEVVDAADAERRRIERDLHDGTQQRLVSLAMNLGMARATLTDLPEPAHQVIVQAHEEAKLALKELRDFVRGLHPAVLNDQGLDAALSGLAARAPLPVRLDVDMPERVSPTVEAVAFFVVSEALTNIAKHAQASEAEVTVGRRDGRLQLAVFDDGLGGADPSRGSGLRGLAQRVGSVDGILIVDSPVGGPTTIRVELPCA